MKILVIFYPSNDRERKLIRKWAKNANAVRLLGRGYVYLLYSSRSEDTIPEGLTEICRRLGKFKFRAFKIHAEITEDIVTYGKVSSNTKNTKA